MRFAERFERGLAGVWVDTLRRAQELVDEGLGVRDSFHALLLCLYPSGGKPPSPPLGGDMCQRVVALGAGGDSALGDESRYCGSREPTVPMRY